MMDLYKKDKENKSHYFLIGIAVLLALIPLGIRIGKGPSGISKGCVSPAYIIVNLSFCPIVFKLVSLFERIELKNDFLVWWGHKPLLIFILQFVLNDALMSLLGDSFEKIPAVAALAFVFGVTAVITFAGYFSYRKSLKKVV